MAQSESMDDDQSPPSFLPFNHLLEAFRGQKSKATSIIEASEFKFEVRRDP